MPSQEINLLSSLPQTKRNVEKRSSGKDQNVIRISKEFGEEYFDGPREYGYGGYRYDGRWLPVARDIVKHFNLKSGDKVLDVGCAKGFLVKDLLAACPGLEVFGLDVSRYALTHCEPETIGRLHLGNARDLPFPDNSFDCILSINTLHNFQRPDVVIAVKEIQRVCKGDRSFIQVDSYHTPEQKELFESWVLTARYHDYPKEWLKLFEEAGYTGDHYWTII
ncbi:class I SAM-dependent methyltransferase [Alphaproteobacteria bacterium]|jgi:ubiquinone/menaquinone biosynthesis C-methylase UbiE|nr:class I SAM-dependent methyltransferase [Alphaproteobacteria bacterium]